MAKIQRNAFLYMSPHGTVRDFAQCASCRLFMPARGYCAVLDTSVSKDDSCGLYSYGEPQNDQKITKSATAKEAGLVRHTQVRCENCVAFDGKSVCNLYVRTNKALPEIYDLDDMVEPKACCNGFEPKPRRALGGAVGWKHLVSKG